MQTITTRTLAPIANEKEEEQLGRRWDNSESVHHNTNRTHLCWRWATMWSNRRSVGDEMREQTWQQTAGDFGKKEKWSMRQLTEGDYHTTIDISAMNMIIKYEFLMKN
jgi:hypothetical protein